MGPVTMPVVNWTCLSLWLLLCQAGLMGCEAYRSSSYRYYGTSGSNTNNGASTYNYYRQTIGPPNTFSNATLYCGLFSISYTTSCKFGAIDAYVVSESAVSRVHLKLNGATQFSENPSQSKFWRNSGVWTIFRPECTNGQICIKSILSPILLYLRY